VVVLLLYGGDQIPVNPFREVVGNITGSPAHTGPIWAKVGVTGLLTVTVTVLDPVHKAVGVVPVTV
jgi:hypothetical protein